MLTAHLLGNVGLQGTIGGGGFNRRGNILLRDRSKSYAKHPDIPHDPPQKSVMAKLYIVSQCLKLLATDAPTYPDGTHFVPAELKQARKQWSALVSFILDTMVENIRHFVSLPNQFPSLSADTQVSRYTLLAVLSFSL